MAAIIVTRVTETNPIALAPEYRAGEGVSSGAVVERTEAPLTLLRHDLAPGAALTIAGPAAAHLFYIGAGEVNAAGTQIGAGGALVVEQAGEARIEAGPDGAVLLDFFDRDEAPLAAPAGLVHTHASSEPGHELPAPYSTRYSLLADSTCPTCALWLHRIEFVEGHKGSLHAHPEDEIIVVVGGEIGLGTRMEPAGCVLAIDAETPYSFRAGTGGVSFINFRSRDPWHITLTGPKKGERHPEGPGMRSHAGANGGWRVPHMAAM
jgi:hypothetical protein